MLTVPHEQVMLDALGHEITEHPERLVPVDAALIERNRSINLLITHNALCIIIELAQHWLLF